MGIGGELVGDVEELLAVRTLRRRALFRMIGMASQCWKAEAEIQQAYSGTRCLLLPSATVGLSLLLEALELPKGSEVLITPFGWVSNWSCIRRAGLVPRFLPLDGRLQLQATCVEDRITERTGAVIVTHLLGRGQQEVDRIAQVCLDRGVILLEDIAQSFGISVKGRRAGTFGLGAWCSLNHHKILSAGDGGFVLTTDPAVFARVSARHDQGISIADGKRRHVPLVEPGLSLRTNEVTASILRGQLARYHVIRARILARHEALAAACRDGLGLDLIEPSEGDIPFTVFFRRFSHMRYPPLVDAGWHVAANVPWLADVFSDAARDDPAAAATIQTLAATAAIGAGFIDRYHGIPMGLPITEPLSSVPALVRALEQQL